MIKTIGVYLAVLSLSGCVTTRTCSQRQVEAIKAQSNSDGDYCSSKINELTGAWIFEYCKMSITEENRIAKLTNSKTIRIPKMCAEIGLVK